MPFTIDDIKIDAIKPLIPPAILIEELPLGEKGSALVKNTRESIKKILSGDDHRLLVVVGPCSIHDVEAALEYAHHLEPIREKYSNELEIVMRVYFEKPRSRSGWKGLINDPYLDESFQINKGLRMGRGLLVRLNQMGIPAAVEFLDTISPQFIGDTVSWGAIGARTTESQVHRELASGLSAPIGFKNGTNGDFGIAVDAIHAAGNPHHFLSVSKQSVASIVATKGNEDCHLILRGAKDRPNYYVEDIQKAVKTLRDSGLAPRVMVDCSHGNSGKDYTKQPEVLKYMAQNLSRGASAVMGVMIESHLKGGKQPFTKPNKLEYGVSVTDACLGWEDTEPLFSVLAEGVKAKRV